MSMELCLFEISDKNTSDGFHIDDFIWKFFWNNFFRLTIIDRLSLPIPRNKLVDDVSEISKLYFNPGILGLVSPVLGYNVYVLSLQLK